MAKFIIQIEVEINESSVLHEYGTATRIMRDTRARISKDFPGVCGSLLVIRKEGEFLYNSTDGSSRTILPDPNAKWVVEE